MTKWRYQELLQGNSYIGYVMDGKRVVCRREWHGIDVLQSPGREVERTRRELRLIVESTKAEGQDNG